METQDSVGESPKSKKKILPQVQLQEFVEEFAVRVQKEVVVTVPQVQVQEFVEEVAVKLQKEVNVADVNGCAGLQRSYQRETWRLRLLRIRTGRARD